MISAELRQFVAVLAIGLVFTYLGVLRTASTQFETFGDLGAVQRSRADLSSSANSGFGQDVDVSTTAGALSAIPLGGNLSFVRAVSVASGEFAPEHHAAGNDRVVGVVSLAVSGRVVHVEVSFAAGAADTDLPFSLLR